MDWYSELIAQIKPFAFHKARRRIRRIERRLGPPQPMTLEEQAESERVAALIDHWAKTGKVFTIPDVPL
jgi:hypothetical protein